MIYHDVLAQMLYEDQKRKLNFITWKGWQLLREEHTQAAAPRKIDTGIQAQQHTCAAC
ncbi:hypothetical protein G3578_12075 [Brevibacillus sp. SYP-B805]|uniref:hypothetical protein n=1 Tax=Brevibacillus sp. SYP-B805 TaxID=1578199 RepID=UPI0013ED0F53|nr:hypothetical protein [Brevibacillus sp. SYP-B805]NGQ95893.1 hypothetical protein [Brevibacillus sp. SYP-B805]